MAEITLVTDQQDDNLLISMLTKFGKPTPSIIKSLLLSDIIDKKGANSSSVITRALSVNKLRDDIVRTSDSSVTLLTGSIPDLGLDCLIFNLKSSSGEFDTNCALALSLEVVLGEAKEEVRFTDS